MKEENIYQKHRLHLFAILMLLLVPLLSFAPGTTAQAAGYDNPACTLTSTSDSSVTTTATPNTTTVLLFGHTKCRSEERRVGKECL